MINGIVTTANLQNPISFDDNKAREWLEARVWPNGPVCPHCGVTAEHITKLEGQTHRPGLYQCNAPECREQFTVTVKPFSSAARFRSRNGWRRCYAHGLKEGRERAPNAPLACHHIQNRVVHDASLARGVAGRRVLSVRLRRQRVEADETYIGRIKGQKVHPGGHHQYAVLALLDRDTKQVRTFHVDQVNAEQMTPIVRANIAKEAHLMTDTGKWFKPSGREVARHETANHHWEE